MSIFDKILAKVKKVIKVVNLKPIADDAADRIKKRTRLGYGVKDGERGGPRVKLKGLSNSYKKQRKKYLDINKKYTTANKSNLTKTGQLLDSLIGKVSNKKIIIKLKENRDDGEKNKDIVDWQSSKGRDFFELTDKEIKGLRSQLKKDLIKLLKKK